MHIEGILQELLGTSIHKTRIMTLSVLIEGVISSKKLQLTALGRHIKINGKERSAINRVDRFLGNTYYHTHYKTIYRSIIQKAVGLMKAPLFIVDWSSIPGSHLTAAGEHCLLRASLAAQGRSITLYEEIHPKSNEGNAKVHKEFLNHLKSLIPSDCTPCIITDAGFKNPWFKAVLALGWNYVGRLNASVHYDEGAGFKALSELFPKAAAKPQDMGTVVIAKTNPLTTKIYLYKKPPKGRKHKGKTGKVITNKQSRKNAKSNKEPWILTSSLTGNHIEQLIIKYYKLRMTIEESFRDTKSHRYGLSFNNNVTIDVARYKAWFILSALACFIAWVVGYTAEQLNLHYDFQANSYKHRRVLSFFFLGCQVIIKQLSFPISLDDIQLNKWGILYG